jgi:hypothetical protein
MIFIGPTYTSKTSSACSLIGHRRKHLFKCSCGFSYDADVNPAHKTAAQGALVVGFTDAVNCTERELSAAKQMNKGKGKQCPFDS